MGFIEAYAMIGLGLAICLALPNLHQVSARTRMWLVVIAFAPTIQRVFFSTHASPFSLLPVLRPARCAAGHDMKLVQFLAAALASLALYLLVFGGAVGKPLTVGIIFDMLHEKLAHAEAASGPKILVFAGSNARFSHSCAVLAEELGRPCTNFGIAAGVGMDFLTARIEPLIGPGDLIYIPLEYPQYKVSQSEMLGSAETGEWVRRDPAGLLAARGPVGLLRAAFRFDLSWLLQGAFETAFQSLGGKRRFGLDTMNAMGDEVGHTAARSAPYMAFIARHRLVPAGPGFRTPAGRGGGVLGAFVEDAVRRGATVVGGLPTTFDDRPIPAAVISRLAAFYRRHGGSFLALPNLLAYPRSQFYNSRVSPGRQRPARSFEATGGGTGPAPAAVTRRRSGRCRPG